MRTLHEYQIKGIEGEMIDFAKFKGKKVLIVNVASACGYTSQYSQLQELWEEFNEKLVIVGCPCNQFGGQEPGENEDIRSFCTIRYGVTFPLSTKIDVKGKNQHEVYQWLTSKELNGKVDTEVNWNFNKFLVDENGEFIEYFSSSVTPLNDRILRYFQ